MVLKTFTDSARFPLSQLNLTGATLNDEILADLLLTHRHVSKIDLTDVKVREERNQGKVRETPSPLPSITTS